MASTNLAKFDQAERSLEALLARGEQEQWPRAHLIMGLAHGSRNYLHEAMDSYRAFLRVAPQAPPAEIGESKLGELHALQEVGP